MYRSFAQFAQNLRNTLLDILFPRSCLGCGKAETTLCFACLADVKAPIDNLPAYIHALYTYKHPLIKKSIWKLKYNYTHDLARVFGSRIRDAILEDVSEGALPSAREIYLIPIPLASRRMRERGYNQTKLLSTAIRSTDTSGALLDGTALLKRNDMRVRQSHTKGKRERLKNIVGTFYATRALSPRAHYILIDDVVTTGATIEEARRVLMEAGARKVTAYAVAH